MADTNNSNPETRPQSHDWILDPRTFRLVNLPEFLELGNFVGQVIKDGDYDIANGSTDDLGMLILAQLARVKDSEIASDFKTEEN